MKLNKQGAIDLLKGILIKLEADPNMPIVEETTEVKMMANVPLKSGDLMTSPNAELESGVEVFITSASTGESVPAAIGEYELADGRIAVVDVQGLFSNFKTDVIEEPAPVVESVEELEADDDKEKPDAMVEIKEMLSKMNERIEKMEAHYGEKEKENEELLTHLSKVTAELAKPAVESIEKLSAAYQKAPEKSFQEFKSKVK
jgi:hypothetical protein